MGRRSEISLGRLVMQYEIPKIGFVRLPEVLTVIPVGKTCWWEGVKSGRYPKPVKISARCTAWRAEDIRELVTRIERQNMQDSG
jgi:predicted DNA-binding transcriptional regulator AlpA